MSDEEWAFLEPFVIERGPLRGRPARDHRHTLDAVFWIARTGAPWSDLPEELGNWNSVHQQYRRWTTNGLDRVPPRGVAAALLGSLSCLSGQSWQADEGIVAERRDGFQRHVAGTLNGPFIVLLE